jgi:large subunit ribosomal protein L17
MRHGKHNHILGVKKEHRKALLANLAVALITHGRIETTLAKAKALRPFIEKVITLAKRANQIEAVEQKLHFRRLAIARVRDVDAIRMLFDEKVVEFLRRNGGYTRIYKLVPRRGDASPMAIIEFVSAGDVGYKKARRRRAKKAVPSKMISEPVLDVVE